MAAKTKAAPRLPTEYQEVEYIENESTAFIKTGYTFTSNNARYKGALYKSERPASEQFVVGSGSYSGGAFKTMSELGLGSTNRRIFAFSNTSAGINGYANLYGNKVYFDAIFQTASPAKRLTISTDGSNETTETATGENNTIAGSICTIFSGSPTKSLLTYKGRIYFLEVYDNNLLVCSFVPCYRKQDGKVGLYDTVRNAFYYSPNSSNFTKGANVN